MYKNSFTFCFVFVWNSALEGVWGQATEESIFELGETENSVTTAY
jgi:hypothetical protein